jgi:tRNA U34 2-thiouridine synthase MnmA/TrmU
MYGGIYYTLMQNASLKLKGKKDLYETEKMMNNLFRKQNPGD